MQQKRHTPLWQKSLALLSICVLLCFSAATPSHIHAETHGSLLQQECVLCVIGGQGSVLPGVAPLIAAFLFVFFRSLQPGERPVLASYRSPGIPRAPPLL